MARPLRIEYPGACYHVMNRGNQRARVFHEPNDYELFLARVGDFTELHDVHVSCYCCMPNHFHLYLKTEQANLSRFMQGLLTSFCVTMNRRRRTSGHIFQGRFKAQLVDDEGYGSDLTRYIHLNPVRVARLKGASLARRRQALRAFPWSSFPAIIGIRRGPSWLDVDPVLTPWGQDRRTQMKTYRRYVEAGLAEDVANPFDGVVAQTILGRESFVDRIRREYLLTRPADRREETSLVRLQQSFSLRRVAEVVGRVCGVCPEDVLRRRGPHRLARRLLMYCACHYGRCHSSLTALAKVLSVSVSGLTIARDRLAASLGKDRRLRTLLRKVERELGPIEQDPNC